MKDIKQNKMAFADMLRGIAIISVAISHYIFVYWGGDSRNMAVGVACTNTSINAVEINTNPYGACSV